MTVKEDYIRKLEELVAEYREVHKGDLERIRLLEEKIRLIERLDGCIVEGTRKIESIDYLKENWIV